MDERTRERKEGRKTLTGNETGCNKSESRIPPLSKGRGRENTWLIWMKKEQGGHEKDLSAPQ